MAGLLAGKSAIVTGGVTGIGRAISLEFLRQGASVTVNHLGDAQSQEHLETLRAEAPDPQKVVGAAGDIGKQETGQFLVQVAVENFGGVDIFVANAGVSLFRDFLSYVCSACSACTLDLTTDIGSRKQCSNLIYTQTSKAPSGPRKRQRSRW